MSKAESLKNSNTISKVDVFEKLGKKGVFVTLGLLMFVAFFVFKDFILLKKLFLFQDIGSDTVNGAWPFFQNFANYFQRYGLPTWSFQEGMGQNVLGGFLRDPFMLIAYVIGPASMPKIYVYIVLLEIISSGLIFYVFLKQLHITNYTATIGALVFSFSGFMIIGACWYVFTYEAFTLAVALLGFELYFQKNKFIVFVLGIALIAISMPFNLYVIGIILLFYIIFRLGQTEQLNAKNFFNLIGRLCVFGLIGLMLAAPFLFESVLQLLESPRGSGSNSYTDILSSKPMFETADKNLFGTFISRLFSSDYLGSGSNFKGWQNFLEAPVSYCGILTIILMPQIFTSVSKSQRKHYLIWLLVWLIPTLFPYFRYAFWLFSGDYFRIFSFCISLVFIIYSALALDTIIKNKKINLIALIASVVLSIILLSYNYFKGTSVHPDGSISIFVKASIVIYAVLLFLLTKSDNILSVKYTLLAFMCVELIYLSSFSINRRDAIYTRELTEKVAYNDYSIEAVNYIKKNETGFYRIDKNYFSSGAIHGSLNDNKIHDYYGTSSYSSFANNNYITYLKKTGVITGQNEYESRWAPGLLNRPILQSLNQVKYILVKGGYTNPVWHNTHDSVAKFGDVLVLKNKFNLTFGYTYNTYVKQSDYEKLSINQKDFVNLKAIVINDNEVINTKGLKQYNIADTLLNNQFTFDTYKINIDALKQNTFNVTSFSDIKIEGDVTANETKIMYLSFPNEKGWHLTLDDVETNLLNVNNGMTGVYLTQGKHTIELNYKTRLFYKGLLLVPVGLLLILIAFILNKKIVMF